MSYRDNRRYDAYSEPHIEVCEVAIESGYAASYGDTGDAGDEFDVNDNGIF